MKIANGNRNSYNAWNGACHLLSRFGERRYVSVEQAAPMAFLPVYARRWQAYRNATVAIVGTKGWER